jgi:glucose/mannose transport system permease protein
MSRDDSGLDGRRVGLYAVLLGMVGFYLAPLQSGFVTSLKTDGAFAETTPFVPPTPGDATVEPWFEAFDALFDGLINSLLFAVPATIASAFLGSIAAYGLTKLHWRGQIAVLIAFLAGVFIPYQAVLVPLRQFWSAVDLESMLWFAPILANHADLIELSITHAAYGIPICTILFRAYYHSLSDEMLEAARIDGASVGRIYRRIVLPLSMPMFAVTLIYQFTQIWNDLLFALVIVQSRSNFVVTMALNELQGSMAQAYNIQMAGAFIAALPTLIIYIIFGKQFAEGVAGGT